MKSFHLLSFIALQVLSTCVNGNILLATMESSFIKKISKLLQFIVVAKQMLGLVVSEF